MNNTNPIPCQCCGTKYLPSRIIWFECSDCGYRICQNCLSKHRGKHNSMGGYKCSQCTFGQLKGPKEIN